jgi:hypothetical protein
MSNDCLRRQAVLLRQLANDCFDQDAAQKLRDVADQFDGHSGGGGASETSQTVFGAESR